MGIIILSVAVGLYLCVMNFTQPEPRLQARQRRAAREHCRRHQTRHCSHRTTYHLEPPSEIQIQLRVIPLGSLDKAKAGATRHR